MTDRIMITPSVFARLIYIIDTGSIHPSMNMYQKFMECCTGYTYRLRIIAETNLEYIKKVINYLLKCGLIHISGTSFGKIIYDITPKGEKTLEIYQRQRELLER